MPTVPVTVVLPTLDGGPLFTRVLAALGALEPAPERVVVLDSESTDGTAERARDAGLLVKPIRRREFDHGATRMLGVAESETPFVAFLSQDVVPSPDYLAPLVAAFDDPTVAGATARILPHDESSLLARRTVLAAWPAGAERVVIGGDAAEFAALDGAGRRSRCRFDDVASMVRRELLLRFPFPRTMMGEDALFAEQVLAAGYRLVFEPRAVVRHAHEYGPLSAFRRYRDDARWARARYGERIRRTPFDVARGVAYEVREDLRFLRGARDGRFGAALRSPFLRTAQVLGQWWGSITGAGP